MLFLRVSASQKTGTGLQFHGILTSMQENIRNSDIHSRQKDREFTIFQRQSLSGTNGGKKCIKNRNRQGQLYQAPIQAWRGASIINNGDIPTNITVKETVPRNATFLSGAMSFSGFLNPGETANIIYNISAPAPGTLEFKAPEMSSKNQGFEWYAQLPVKKLQVLSHESKAGIAVNAPAPVNTPEKVSEQGLAQLFNKSLPWLGGGATI